MEVPVICVTGKEARLAVTMVPPRPLAPAASVLKSNFQSASSERISSFWTAVEAVMSEATLISFADAAKEVAAAFNSKISYQVHMAKVWSI